jgi:hypothetical protein
MLKPELRMRNTRMARLSVGMGLLCTSAALALLSLRDFFLIQLNMRLSAFFAVEAVLLLYGLGLLFFSYIRGDIELPGIRVRYKSVFGHSSELGRQELIHLRYAVDELRARQAQSEDVKVGLTESEKAELVGTLRSRIQEGFKAELVKEFEEKYSSSATDSKRLQTLKQLCDAAIRRLLLEIEALSRRGSVNLFIGIVTSAVAVGLLAYIVLTAKMERPDATMMLAHFLPRLSLAVFVEVFSFFFLRLYRMSLMEIKYFQNEVTNLEAKFIAIFTAVGMGNDSAVNSSLSQLAKTERNFILKKGETTVDLEKEKFERQEVINTLEQLAKILPKLKWGESK